MEDTEIGYRLYRNGAWFIPVSDAKALHQEPPGGSNETNRTEGREITEGQFVEKCPAKYRPYEAGRTYDQYLFTSPLTTAKISSVKQ